MAEEEVWQIWIFFLDDVHQTFFVFNHRFRTFVAPVAPGAVQLSRFAVADVVICSDDEACFQIAHDHVEIAAGMLAKTMHQLHDADGICRRHIDPGLHIVAFVVGWESEFV